MLWESYGIRVNFAFRYDSLAGLVGLSDTGFHRVSKQLWTVYEQELTEEFQPGYLYFWNNFRGIVSLQELCMAAVG